MKKEFTSDDIISRRNFADLQEYGEFRLEMMSSEVNSFFIFIHPYCRHRDIFYLIY